jgi:cysteine synthase
MRYPPGCKEENMVHTSVLDAIGNTPMVELQRVGKETGCRLLVKLEYMNPGGSVKSRTAAWMVECALKEGKIGPDSIIVEATSGNQGIGLAMVGAALGIKVRICMPESMSRERQQLMRAYGADVVLTPAGANIAQAIRFAMTAARDMAQNDPKVFWVNQFTNLYNPDVHRRKTGAEILKQVGKRVDAFISGIGTGGTITGIGQALKTRYPKCMVVAAEPENAAILSGGTMGQHIQQGIGDGLIPDVLDCGVIDKIVIVTDDDALQTARALARYEGMFAGVSSGTNVWTGIKIAQEMGPGKTIVMLLPDGGERYLSAGIIEDGQ